MHILILINVTEENDEEIVKEEEQEDEKVLESEEMDDRKEDIQEKKHKNLIKLLKQEVYFHLLPQHNKHLEVFDIFDEGTSNKQVAKLRNIIINYIKNFD